MKTAIVYDRVNKWGGAERTLLALQELFPEAPIFTAVYSPKSAPWAKVFAKVVPSFLNRIAFFQNKHELLGTLTPIAFESFNFSEYDLMISVTSEAAKGIITKPPTKHICYCLTPTRYLWSHHSYYFDNPPSTLGRIPFFKYISKPIVSYLKTWDKIAAQRPDVMVAISKAVQNRIKKYYGRESEVIYPPVDLEKFLIKNSRLEKEDYFLFVSRLIPYKRADLAIRAFNDLGYPLVVVGVGSEKNKLQKMAKKNINFLGSVSDDKLAELYQKARALVFPGEEDFGIVMVEAQASGTPVIAYKKGGALDIIKNEKTGILFEKQTKKSLVGAIKRFKELNFKKGDLISNAKSFSKQIFQNKFLDLINH